MSSEQRCTVTEIKREWSDMNLVTRGCEIHAYTLYERILVYNMRGVVKEDDRKLAAMVMMVNK